MNQPLVSVICLCYNQVAFVKEALESVWAQSYQNLELIIVDDGSSDGSADYIRELIKDRWEVKFLALDHNSGNCRAFNRGWEMAKGDFIIDLAADDILLPERVELGVKQFESSGREFGVNFTDATYVDKNGRFIRNHYRRDKEGRLAENVPQGWVYEELLKRYYVCTPSMMFRKEVLFDLGGYDEALAYEDFDFWVRSSRNWKYCYTDKVLVKKRIVPNSWSTRQYFTSVKQLETTLEVCRKAKNLNISKEENLALGKRLTYEIRQAIRHQNFVLAEDMLDLKKEIHHQALKDLLFAILIKVGPGILRIRNTLF